ncbi:jg25240, partial [Pararge aegeria aegeria]
MKVLTCFTVLALVGIIVATPTTKDNKLVVTKDVYFDDSVKYRGEHEIVNILVPLNSLNFKESTSSESESQEEDSATILFFVEADIQSDGTRVDQGLYVLKDGKAKKILKHGRDAAASSDDSKLAFFGAQDGLYVYNDTTNSADKYGPITDSIIAIAKEKEGDAIYILTEDHEVYKISNNGETKVKLDDVVNAKEIVLDYSDNLYFVGDDNKPYVRTADGVKEVGGLPHDLSDVKLIKPPFILDKSVP